MDLLLEAITLTSHRRTNFISTSSRAMVIAVMTTTIAR